MGSIETKLSVKIEGVEATDEQQKTIQKWLDDFESEFKFKVRAFLGLEKDHGQPLMPEREAIKPVHEWLWVVLDDDKDLRVTNFHYTKEEVKKNEISTRNNRKYIQKIKSSKRIKQ